MNKQELEDLLIVGAKIKIGDQFADRIGLFDAGEIIELVEGYFEYDNGLYTETHGAPSVWYEQSKDWDSIYYLFGNNLEDFLDCEVLNN